MLTYKITLPQGGLSTALENKSLHLYSLFEKIQREREIISHFYDHFKMSDGHHAKQARALFQ